MGIFSPKFMGYDQHDSQEFLTYTLDGIHTELNRIEKNGSSDKVRGKLFDRLMWPPLFVGQHDDACTILCWLSQYSLDQGAAKISEVKFGV